MSFILLMIFMCSRLRMLVFFVSCHVIPSKNQHKKDIRRNAIPSTSTAVFIHKTEA